MSYNIRFTEPPDEQPKLIWPARVKTLFDCYAQESERLSKAIGRKINCSYIPETIDYLEKLFYDRVRAGKKDSLRTTINSVYRIRTAQNEEYYFYAAFHTANNKFDQPIEPFSWETYGYFRRPVINLALNEQRGEQEPRVTAFESCYQFPWDKEEVKKLIDSSYIPVQNLYVGKAGTREPIEMPYSILNLEDFLEGSWQDLWDLSRLGLTYPEPSRHLVEPGRKKEKENREEKVGLRGENRAYG